jgi:MraZ protein
MQFHGEFHHRVDPQGRVAIPARYRDAFAHGIYLTRGFDPCIWAFSPAEWETYSLGYSSMSPNSRIGRTLRRRVFGSTFDLELDRQGRVVLPQPLRQYAGLQDEVVVVGAGTWLELWDGDRWNAEIAEIDVAELDLTESGREDS